MNRQTEDKITTTLTKYASKIMARDMNGATEVVRELLSIFDLIENTSRIELLNELLNHKMFCSKDNDLIERLRLQIEKENIPIV